MKIKKFKLKFKQKMLKINSQKKTKSIKKLKFYIQNFKI